MAVETIPTGHFGTPEMGRRQAHWMDGDDVLVIAYGSGDSGVVVRVDLKGKKLLGVSTPPECPVR